MRDKLIELIVDAENDLFRQRGFFLDRERIEKTVDYLISNGVTVQTTPISYERLLKLALKMHCWIFLHCADELEVYNQLGLTEEENYVFGYGGKLEMPSPAAPKEGE